MHSPSSSLSKGRSGARVHRVGGKGEGRGGRHGSGGEVTAKEKGQKKSFIRDIDPARFVFTVIDLTFRGHFTYLVQQLHQTQTLTFALQK